MYLYSTLHEAVGLRRIHILGPGVAHVQVRDAAFAGRIKGRFDACRARTGMGMQLVQVAVEIGYEESSREDPPLIPDFKLRLLQDRRAMIRLRDRPASSECAVCLTEAEAEEPCFETPCRHRYCGACFRSQCFSSATTDFPLRCLGDAGKCLRIFLLTEVEGFLGDSSVFEQLLARSFALYLRSITSIKRCPTTDCEHEFRITTDGSVLTCPDCDNPVCTTCLTPSHAGVTCRVYQIMGKEEKAVY